MFNFLVDISGAECQLLLASVLPHWKAWSPNSIWPVQTTDFACCVCRLYGWATHTIRYLLSSNIFFKETCYSDLLTYSTEQSPSSEANSFSASQEIPSNLRNPKVHYHIHKSPPPNPFLSQIDPAHGPTFPVLKILLNIILPSTPGFSRRSLSLRLPHRSPVYNSPPLHTCYMLRLSNYYRLAHPNTRT